MIDKSDIDSAFSKEPLEFHPVHSIIADWHTWKDMLRSIRQTVFIEEQHVSEELEWDGQDEDSLHFLAILDHEPVACARLTKDGQLGRIAVLKEKRKQGIGSALMRFILLEAPKLDYSSLYLHAQTQAMDFYTPFGFEAEGDTFQEAGIDHQKMKLLLPPDRTHIHSGSEIIHLETIEDFRQYALQLALNTRYKLAIFTPDLEPSVYDNEEFCAAVMEIANRTRYSLVRILVKDTKHLVETGHGLLRMYQRSPHGLEIRKLDSTTDYYKSAYLLSDDCGILHRTDDRYYQGSCYLENRGRVRSQMEEFDHLWNSSHPDPELKRLSV